MLNLKKSIVAGALVLGVSLVTNAGVANAEGYGFAKGGCYKPVRKVQRVRHYEEPCYDEPAYEEPCYDEPQYDEPHYEEPCYEDNYVQKPYCKPKHRVERRYVEREQFHDDFYQPRKTYVERCRPPVKRCYKKSYPSHFSG